MAEHRALAAGEHRGHPATPERDDAVAEGIYPVVHHVQPAGRNAAVDRAGMQGEAEELPPVDHGVLPLRDGHDLSLDGSTSIIDVDPTFACHGSTLPSENARMTRAL